jgi:hypothetical protein
MAMRRPRRPLTAALSLAVMLLLAACGTQRPATSGTALSERPTDLRGVCPDPVVIQTAWYPEAARATWYHLLGKNPVIDAGRKRVTGPLVTVTDGRSRKQVDTGVRLEVRAGGPAVGFEQDSALLYLHKEILGAEVSTDEAIQNAAKQPTVATVALLDLDPLVLMWAAKAHPEFHTVADVGQTNTKVVYFQNNPYMAYLLGSGILRESQVDGSYDGSPARFVASGGTIVQQGYVTNEPYLYEHELAAWRGEVKYQLINDTGYPNYTRATLAVRAADKTRLAPCLRRLVPVVQRAIVDYLARPQATNQLILRLDKAYKSALRLSPGLLAYGRRTMLKEGIVGNGRDRTVGNFDPARVQRMVEIVNPILTSQRKPTKRDLTPSDLVTNEFVDPAISLSP